MKAEISPTEEQIKNYRLKLGDRIRTVREKRGYSQEQLAEKMDINRSTISKIENGKFGITVDYLVRFSIFLDYEFKVFRNLIEKMNKVIR
jgi:transcriptional regulator with XRE-family HTH domain